MMAEEITLFVGDCLDVLRGMPVNSVDSIVTDPPYGLSFMGKAWDGSVPGAEMWAEVLRVLKPGGHLLAFAGTRTQHRMACAIEDAGFEIRDMIGWAYGSGFPKSHDVGKKVEDRKGWGTALKPAWEPITVARKPLEGTVAKNVLSHGTGALNIDGCRVHGEDAQGGDYTVKRLKPGATLNKTGGNWRPDEGVEYHGNLKPGRWPANIIHDGSDEVVACFPEKAGAAAPVTRRGSDKFRNAYGKFAGNVDEAGSTFRGDSGSAARFFYCAKASKADRDHGLDHLEEQQFVQWQTGNGASGKPSSMSEGRDTRRKNTHPTVKPTDLMRYLCRLVTPPGGVVLDPFMGSGSTGRGAVLEGFRFIGIEMEAEYVDFARARIEAAHVEAAAASAQSDLFEGAS